ncbi:putative ankyrin repeat protein [Powai lake megavirus]|uniref:Putative ankyrin repeat protein n=1 Tax=Powai lake megavirus TaxID=1842663 RepID=A0A167R265_9VIRU|nr:putative ankyrin repeat protein [Powai lake megavirus]ANB50222.1 putative ankyrin repeat protein [Powai lake megavirus]
MNAIESYDFNKEYILYITKCINTKCRYFTKLMWLINHENILSNGHEKIIRHLKKEKNLKKINDENEKGWTALMMASTMSNSHSSYQTVELLLELGANINIQSNCGCTALIAACINSGTISSNKTVNLLIDHGANINLKNKFGKTALEYACINSKEYGSTDTVKILLKKGANINSQNNFGQTSLISSIINHNYINIEIIKLLLDHGADIEAKNIEGMTALMYSIYALKSNGLDIVKLLLKYGANIEAKTDHGLTFLMLICINIIEINNDEAIEYVIDRCPNINSVSNEGCTALMYTCRLIGEKSTVKIIELLLKHGACPNITNNGMTVLRKILQMNQNDDLVKLLLQYNANPNVVIDNINDLLFVAKNIKSENKLNLLLLLLDYGADYQMIDENDYTFIDFINDEEKIICANKIETMALIKNNINTILISIPDIVTEYMYNFNSFSVQLLNLKWSINNYNSRDELPEHYLKYYDYFNAMDFDDFIHKVHDAIKCMY